jgi:hypothetical protein
MEEGDINQPKKLCSRRKKGSEKVLRLLLVVEKPRRLEGWGCVGTPRKEE